MAAHGQDFRYGKYCGWLQWDGQRWTSDDADTIVQCAKAVAETLLVRLIGEKNKRTITRILKSQDAAKLHAMAKLAQSEPPMPVRASALDHDPWAFNVRNGTLDLRTGQLRPHRREDLITRLAPVPYDPAATCPRWEQFLNEIFRQDQDLIAFMQRFVGYCLTGNVQEDVFSIWYGDGENGKTTLRRVLHALLGDYALSTPASTFLEKKSAIPNDIARLRGARLVVAVEPERGVRLAIALIKAMTGRDPLPARFLFKEYFEFLPTFKPVLVTNTKPPITEQTRGAWRRIKLVPFLAHFAKGATGTELGLEDRLVATELSGILRWAVQGCLAWQERGALGDPTAVTEATADYRAEMDTLGPWLEAQCVIDAMLTTKSRDLLDAYVQWCRSKDQKVMRMASFWEALTERGFVADKEGKERTRIRRGLGLRWQQRRDAMARDA